MLAVRDDGVVEGSVSGGCVEDDLVGRVRADGMTAKECTVVTYGVSADEARRFGLPCGGTIQLVLEPLGIDSGIRDLLAATEGGRLVARRLELATGAASLAPARASDGLTFDGSVLTTIHGPRYRMLVIGASQLSKYLAQMALGLDYQVTVRSARHYRHLMSKAPLGGRCPTTPCSR
jgi:xanthine dehydrogenase accessory factor